MARRATGTGPGVITADGCAVDLYLALPPGDEPAMVRAVAAPGATVLELGAGAGRVTHPLVDAGFSVTAVDFSTGMLRHIRGAATVVSSIELVRLNRTFDVVLLASHLVNTPDDGQRRAFLKTCAAHLAADGVLLVERHPPDWFATADENWQEAGGLRCRLHDVQRDAPDLLSATVEYHLDERVWTQTFTARRLDDAELAAELAACGLRLDGFLDERRCWARVTRP